MISLSRTLSLGNQVRTGLLTCVRPLRDTNIPSSKRASLGLSSTPHAPVEFIEGRRGCVLCKNGLDKFGYRDVLLLRQFLTPNGLIIGHRQTGICRKMQRRITRAIRRSRKIGLLPNFTQSPTENSPTEN